MPEDNSEQNVNIEAAEAPKPVEKEIEKVDSDKSDQPAENLESNVTVPENQPGFVVEQQIAPSLEGRSMGVVAPK